MDPEIALILERATIPVWLSVGALSPNNVGCVVDPTDFGELASLLRAVADELEALS